MKSDDEERLEFISWLRTRPKHIQELAVRFPPACTVRSKGKAFFIPPRGGFAVVIGYREDGCIIVGQVQRDPLAHYGFSLTGMHSYCDADELEVHKIYETTADDVRRYLLED